MATTITQMSPAEIYQRLNEDPVRIQRDAYENGFNLSGWLERLNPTEPNDRNGSAFSRLLREAGIRTRSDLAAGYVASNAGDFVKPGGPAANRALLMEFFARTWRRVMYAGHEARRAVYLSSDGVAGSWQRPYADAQQARWSEEIAPAIPLSELVALTSPIDSDLYRTFYLTYNAEQLRKFRVGESAEIPVAKLADSEHTVELKKYGRGLEASYEQLRRMRVDKLAMQIAFMAIQSEIDKVAAAIDVIVNGDGNSGTAATSYNLTTLDSGTSAGTLTLKGWLAFKLKFANPYFINVALMQEAVALQLQLLNMGSGNVPLVSIAGNGMIGGLQPINRFADNVGFGWTTDAPTLKIVGIDSRRALEHVVEIGSEIEEMDRFITKQTQVMTMTEVSGFAVLDQNAANVLDVNA